MSYLCHTCNGALEDDDPFGKDHTCLRSPPKETALPAMSHTTSELWVLRRISEQLEQITKILLRGEK